MLRSLRTTDALLLGLSLVFSVVVAEVLVRLFTDIPDPYASAKSPPQWAYVPSYFTPNMRLELRTEPGLPGMPERDLVFSVNNLGFRGDALTRPKPSGEYRVFMVGGSTTECLYLDDAESLTRRLQEHLRANAPPGVTFTVYGAGKSGDRSFDHVAMIGQRIAHLEPDLIIVFAGINDLMAAMNNVDYLMFPDQRVGRPSLSLRLRFFATNFRLARLVYYAFSRQDAEAITFTSRYRLLAQEARRHPEMTTPPRTDVEPYQDNLRSIVGLARAQGASVVLMTQATTWNSTADPAAMQWHWLTRGDGGERRHTEEHLDRAMESYNDAMRSVADELDVPLFDLAATIPKSLGYFYDDVHFNVNGAATTAKQLADFIADHVTDPEGHDVR